MSGKESEIDVSSVRHPGYPPAWISPETHGRRLVAIEQTFDEGEVFSRASVEYGQLATSTSGRALE